MEPIKERRWVLRNQQEGSPLRDDLDDLRLHPWLVRLLNMRGISDRETIQAFLSCRLADLPDPSTMKDLDRAVDRLQKALSSQEPVMVHGDYDVDGISAASLLVDFLRSCGADCRAFIPLRMRDGYGLAEQALREAAADGVRLVISVDCGISAVTEADLAKTLGIDLIITDHHHPPADLPDAYAILNPRQRDCDFPSKDLAGVGVAFFLAIGLRRSLRAANCFSDRQEPDLRQLLELVALGTIADLVPLRGVNRTLAKAGIGRMASTHRPGLQELQKVAGVKEVNCGAIGYRLAPRLNAAGRLEDAGHGVDLLLTDDVEQAKGIAVDLDNMNRQRQALELEGYRQAVETLDRTPQQSCIVLADPCWHQGVIGIIASRLVERYHRPTVLIALEGESGKGSARSIQGLNLFEALSHCREHLLGYGGHSAAAGLSISADAIPAFAEKFRQTCEEKLALEDLQPCIKFDGEITLEEIDADLVRSLELLAPFGIGNPEPLFLASAIQVVQVAKVGKGREHLRFIATQGGESLSCIAFGMGDAAVTRGDQLDLLFSMGMNHYRNREEIQLRIKDLRPVRPESPGFHA